MQTIEDLKGKIQSTEDLQSVVKTMKALAAVSIRQYEKAVKALENYNRTVEMGFQIVIRNRPDIVQQVKTPPKENIGAIIYGSDQGMCGQINEQIFSHAMNTMGNLGIPPNNRRILVVGERVLALFMNEEQSVEEYFNVPGSVNGITPLVQELLLKINEWNEQHGLELVYLFYNKQISGAAHRTNSVCLLPLDKSWLQTLKEKEWLTNNLPAYTLNLNQLFSSLIQQYLFVSLYRAFAESLASENTSRLAAMQGAEKNIEERLGELTSVYHQQRQMAITEELLDIVSGFEALKED